MKNEPWYSVFVKTSKSGRGLVNKALFASTIAPIVGGIIVGFAVAYVLVAINMFFTVQNTFVSIPPGVDVALVPSSSPSCVGDYTLSVGSTTIDCIGTSPTTVLCDNGYDGVLYKGALLCPTSSAVVPPGSVCAQGGIVLFYQNANETFNVTNCITDQPTVVNCTNGQSGIRFGNVTVCNTPPIPIVFGGAGASPFITNNATLISFKGLTAGLNMVVTSGGTDNTVATTSTPSFATIAATATSNQFSIGTTNVLTLNFAALATAYTLTVPDFGGTASLVGTLLAQTIGGVKTFSAQTIFSSTSNQFVLGTTNTVTINSIAPAASRTYTIPDSGANSAFVLTDGAQTINGVKTHTSQILVTATTNQFVLGTTNTVTINSPAPAASRTYTIPDTGANSAFVMSDLAQTINGIKTFSAQTLFTSTTNQFVLGTTNTVTINSPAPAASRTYTIPDTGANSAFVMTDLAQTINGIKTFSAKPVLSTNVGAQFNNAGNTASVTVATQAGLSSSITLNLPTTVGNNGDVLMGNGANNINFATPSVKTLYSNTATLTQSNPGAGVFVTLYPAGTVSLTIPANLLIAGSKIRFEIFGTVSTNGASTFSFRNRLDGVTVYGTSSSSNGVILSTIPFSCKGFLSIITAGASGTAISSGTFFAFTSTTNAVAGFTSTATTAIDTTTSHTFDTQFAFSAANVANSIVILGATVQHVKPYA